LDAGGTEVKFDGEELKSLLFVMMRINTSNFNKVTTLRLEKLKPTGLKRDEYRVMDVKPSHKEIFGPDLVKQMTQCQKVAKVNKL